MPSWIQLFEYFSFLLYSFVEYTIWTSKNRTFHSPFYTIFLVIGLVDLIAFPFFQMKPFFVDSGPGRTLLGLMTKSFRDGHAYLDVLMSANRLTIVLFPIEHAKMWQPPNLYRAIAFCIFLMFFGNAYTILIIFLWGWKDEKLSYPQIPDFDQWNRFYYALQSTVTTVACAVMNVWTISKMRHINRRGQWSLLGISVFSTLLAIPSTIYQALMSYTAFVDDPILEKAVFNSMSSWVFLFVGYYQSYWLLAVSSESRREILRFFRRFLSQNVISYIETKTTTNLSAQKSSTNNNNNNNRIRYQSTMQIG